MLTRISRLFLSSRELLGREPNSVPAYLAMCQFGFTSIDTFLEAFLPNVEELQSDVLNYTNIEPVIQFNRVLISISAD